MAHVVRTRLSISRKLNTLFKTLLPNAGSGKTAAFALPMLEQLIHRHRRISSTSALILTPTRELAVQVHILGSYKFFTFCCSLLKYHLKDGALASDILSGCERLWLNLFDFATVIELKFTQRSSALNFEDVIILCVFRSTAWCKSWRSSRTFESHSLWGGSPCKSKPPL